MEIKNPKLLSSVLGSAPTYDHRQATYFHDPQSWKYYNLRGLVEDGVKQGIPKAL